MKSTNFLFDYVHLLYYKCNRINSIFGGSYIDSSDWIKIKKATINPINKKNNKCFQYAVTVALNHEEIVKHAEKITNIKLFTNKYKRERIYFPLEKDFWKKFEKSNVTFGLNVCMSKKKKYILLILKT